MAGEHTLTFNIIMLPVEAEIIQNKSIASYYCNS